MKNQNYFPIIFILAIIIILLFQSCATTDKVTNSRIIQKRKYTKGFYVNTIRNNIKINKSNKLKKQTSNDTNTTINNVVLTGCFEKHKTITDTNPINLLASTKHIPTMQFRKKLPPVYTFNKPQNTAKRILYKNRNEVLPKSLFNKSNEKPKVLPLAVIGFSLSILGLLCILILKNFLLLGIILTLIIELTAFIISVSSLKKINKNPAMYNGKSEAILGIIFSTVIILLPVMFYLIYTYFALSLGMDFTFMI